MRQSDTGQFALRVSDDKIFRATEPRVSAVEHTAILFGCSSLPRLMPPRSGAVFNQEGELSAAIEVRRRFPGITDTAEARACARTIAGWTPLPEQPRPVTRLRPRSR